MRRSTVRRTTAAAAASLVLAALTTVGIAPSGATEEGRLDLPRPARGDGALRLLGDRLDDAAALNRTSTRALSDLLRSDRTAWVDRTGAVFFQDPGAPAPDDEEPAVAAAPLDQTFELHSLPGSQRTIFLDFDGAAASATGWHLTYPDVPTTQPAWDPSGNGPAFTDDELLRIQTVWQVVAEDYAPFGVDVTTADPGPAAINRSSASDPTYGSHVLVTPSTAADAICGGGCGGVAYLDVFGAVRGPGGDGYGYRQPAWVFPQALADSAKNVGEAASHEAGHNFGLSHDGSGGGSYDLGHGSWAPIMGAGYNRPVSQWSQGSYADADNPEDDVAVITSLTGQRPDEAGGTVASAGSLPAGPGYVTGRGDTDMFVLGACSGTVDVTATGVGAHADLDIRLALHDASGAEVASADPPSATIDASTASGLDASVSYAAAPGAYYASVDGVGSGAGAGVWDTGYDDYGSLGAYTLTSSGCVAPAATQTTLASVVTGRSAQLTASVGAAAGSPVGTVELRDGSSLVGTGAVSAGSGPVTVTLTDLPKGEHAFRATFVPASVVSFAGSQSPVVASTVLATPTATGLEVGAVGQQVSLVSTVTAPAGQPAGRVDFRDGAAIIGNADASTGTASLALVGVLPGQHTYTATFVPADTERYDGSASGPRAVTVVSGQVPGVPPTPTPAPAPTPGPSTGPVVTKAPSTVRIAAPRKARRGTRPAVRVSVLRGSAPASGRVVVTVGSRSTTLDLEGGAARWRIPPLRRSRVVVVVRYLGNPTTAPSSASRRIVAKR